MDEVPTTTRGGERRAAAAHINLTAIRHNTKLLRARTSGSELMAVVKADAYGHGTVPAARAAVAGGATWLGVATPQEALELHHANTGVPLLCWLLAPSDDLIPVVAADIHIGVSSRWNLSAVVRAAQTTGRTAKVHLKVDTGLGRNGAAIHEWKELVDLAAMASRQKVLDVVGVWSHLANADIPDDESNDLQLATFMDAVRTAVRADLRPEIRHVANSAAVLTNPGSHLDLVRPGIAVYGLSPIPQLATLAELGLVPAMTLEAQVVQVKRVQPGTGVSYGHTHRTAVETRLALVRLGYADGLPRAASNVAEVSLGKKRRRIAGTVAMDQFVLDVGLSDDVRPGDIATIFGSGATGEPTADDLAQLLSTISFEIVCRIGPRVCRIYHDEPAGLASSQPSLPPYPPVRH